VPKKVSTFHTYLYVFEEGSNGKWNGCMYKIFDSKFVLEGKVTEQSFPEWFEPPSGCGIAKYIIII